ncbi:MAG: hypothetical protein WCK67_06450 [bacterium]
MVAIQSKSYVYTPDTANKSKSTKAEESTNPEQALKRKDKQLEVASYIISMQAAECEQKDKQIATLENKVKTLSDKNEKKLNLVG